MLPQRYLGSVPVHLLIRDLPGTAMPQLVHRRLVLEAIVQPEGRNQLIKSPDAAKGKDTALGRDTACSTSCCKGLGAAGPAAGICAEHVAVAQAGLWGHGAVFTALAGAAG